jgi:UPF0271 protein
MREFCKEGTVVSMHIDLNCDLGESYGLFRVGSDEEILRLVSSANIACGFHAGDFSVMAKTVELALARDVAIGAHPGLPDLQGFGRRWIPYTVQEIHDLVLYQIGALSAFVKSRDAQLSHVKPHGALYNKASVDREVAKAVVRAVRNFSSDLKLYGLSGSVLIEEAREAGLRTVSEVFADRQYQADGTLVPRTHPQTLLHSSQEISSQLVRMIQKGSVLSLDGFEVPLKVETVCLHGDHLSVVANAREIRKTLEKHGYFIRAH